MVLSVTTLGVASQTGSNGFHFTCSPKMQNKFNYMLPSPLYYIFFYLPDLKETYVLYKQRLLVSAVPLKAIYG